MGNATSLRDFLDSIHDPRDLTCGFLRLAEARMREWGSALYLHRDFGRLVEINETNQGNRWFGLMPMFHPGTFRGGEAFWLEGRTIATAEPVMTQAARRYHLWDGSLREALTTLTLYYEDPMRHRGSDECCDCDAPSAELMSGTVTYSGGGWARAD